MNELRFGLVGCGKIAQRHAMLLSNGFIVKAKLKAVCDIDFNRAKDFGDKFGATAYNTIQKMMKSDEVDIVTVLTPSGLHADNVITLAPYGKPIIVEKPMALTLLDADRMIETCNMHGAKLFVIKQNRFNRPVVELRKAVEAGRFGKMILGTVRLRWCRPQSYYAAAPWRGTWAQDGGVLCNQASHLIDLLEWLMGPVASVHGMATTALAKIEAEDTAVVNLRFCNGALGVIEATTATRPKDLEGSISILGERGAVEIGGFAGNELKTWQFEKAEAEDEKVCEEFAANPQHPYGYAHEQYYNHVVDCIRTGKRQLVDGLAGRRSLELISAIYESIESNREISLRFNPNRCRLGIG
jgi:UDP-N-acetyl-2-amino-2-deoxyglucuronate dehydrogenase